MKLFFERLKEIASFLKDFAMCFSRPLAGVVLFWGSYSISSISPMAGTVILAIGFIWLSILLLMIVYMFIKWLIIEPFFTKKGVDRD